MNSCIAIACALGCNPIIFVGLDLAFTDQKQYAEGIIADPSFSEKQCLQLTDVNAQPLLKQDINGQPIYTLWKWIAEAKWISQFAKKHPEVMFINATEGGLGIEEIPNQTLKKVAQQHLQQTENLKARIQTEIQKHPLSYISRQQIVDLMQTLQRSIDQCITYLDILIKELEELTENIKNKRPVPDTVQTSLSMLTTMQLEEEIGYQHLLKTFRYAYARFQYRQTQSLQSPRHKLSKKKRYLKKIELEITCLNFLKQTAKVNRDIIIQALNTKS